LADHPDSAWSALLDEMEADLTRNFDPEHSGAWVPPAQAGDLPPHLFDRARRVFDAQQRAIAVLTEERATVARHLAALRTVPSTGPADQSVYLDVLG
jgi:hypothetical protein